MTTILVIDDHEDNRHLIRTVLGYCGHQVVEASGGREGLDLARRLGPDLIISDILMPGMDGYQFARQLRADERLRDIPILLSSAHYLGPQARAFAADCGVTHFLPKPIEPEDLIGLVDKLLKAAPPPSSVAAPGELQERHLELVTEQLVAKNHDLERTVQRLGALADIGIGLHQATSLSSLLELAANSLRSLTGAAVAVAATASAGSLLIRLSGVGPSRLVDTDGTNSSNPEEGPLATYEAQAAEALAAFHRLLIPATAGGLRVGIIIVAKPLGADDFDSIDRHCASLLANQLAVAIQQMALLDQLRAARDEALAERLRAERAVQAKATFLAAASHDLRQPYQAMELYHGVLASTVSEPALRRPVELLGVAMSAGKELLNALLDLSTLEAGTVQPKIEVVPLSTVCDALAQEFRDQAQAKGLGFSYVPHSAAVITDPVLLGRMVRNLLSNALKYTSSGKILLGCRRLGHRLRIEVLDTGPGIPPDKQDRIFEDFVQLENPDAERVRGLGLGLAVVAKTGRLLGYRVGVRSLPGRGSAFYVEVPAHPCVAAEPLVQPPKHRPAQNATG